MALPVPFPEANKMLIGSREDREIGNVQDLPIHIYRDLDGKHHVVSCWQLDDEERAEVAATGRVWLHAWGSTHPPIGVQGVNPFKAANDG
jgi:hypothetical protein